MKRGLGQLRGRAACAASVRPRGRWAVFAVLASAVVLLGLFDGLLRAGAAREDGPRAAAAGMAGASAQPGRAGERALAVVVDVGTATGALPGIAGELRSRGLPATFRFRGHVAVHAPGAIRALQRRGFAIAAGPARGPAGLRRALDRIAGEAAIVRATGRRPAVDPLARAVPVLLLDAARPRTLLRAQLDALGPRAGAPAQRSAEVAPRASALQRLAALAVTGPLTVGGWLTPILPWALFIAGGLLLGQAAVTLPVAIIHRRLQLRRPRSGFAPTVTILVPAFNEEVGLERAVRSYVASDYPATQIVVIDDGSTDRTAEIAARLCDEIEGVHLVRKPNGGKASALNRGLREARGDIIVSVDADTVFEPGTLRALVEPFADATVGAVSGNLKVGNRSSLLGKLQHIEYTMGFNSHRRLYDIFGCVPTVPGAAGAYRREAVLAVGGVSTATLAEDTDLSIAIQRAGWRVLFAAEARAWTEAPSTWSGLWSQRYRWNYGVAQAIFKHRDAILRPRRHERRLGWVGIPYLTVYHYVVPLLLPVADTFVLIGVLLANPLISLAWFGGSSALAMTLAGIALWIDREPLRALWVVPLDSLGFRQLRYLSVLTSMITAAVGSRLRWHKLRRTGDVRVHDAPTGAVRRQVTDLAGVPDAV